MKRNNITTLLPTAIVVVVLVLATVEATTYQEYLCSMRNYGLRNCKLQCPEGKLWKDGCPMCACRHSICQGKCLMGERCTVIRQTSTYYNRIQDTDVAVCEPAFAPLPIRMPVEEVATTVVPATPAPESRGLDPNLGACNVQGLCDATGRCPSVNSVCRKDGYCCRVGTNNLPGKDSNLKTGIARCLETPDEGHCRALGVQYVYNVTTGKCQSMMYGGCTFSRNSFANLQQCQSTCEYPCQRPKIVGRCRVSIPRFYFNELTEQCEQFDYGGCAGGNTNSFMTPYDCETHCKGLRKSQISDRGQGIGIVTTQPAYQTSQGYNNDKVNFNRGGQTTDGGTLRDRIVNRFRKPPAVQNRARTDTNTDTGSIAFRRRPNGGRGNKVFTVGDDGRVAYVDDFTTESPTQDDTYRHLLDRFRNRQDEGTTQAPVVWNRGYNGGQPQENSYMDSVYAIQRFFRRGA